MTIASLLQVIAQEANRYKVHPQGVFKAKTSTGFGLSGMTDGTYLYWAIRKDI